MSQIWASLVKIRLMMGVFGLGMSVYDLKNGGGCQRH
jgi:hypothetical protein